MSMPRSLIMIPWILLGVAACTLPQGRVSVTSPEEVAWEHLNPARGDAAPSAATLWGSRTDGGPAGFLLRPRDGFESPPHLHNVSYRGVVIRGLLHNDDPQAEKMWMPPGSFWTQPAGEVHITAARGEDVLAYIEIEEGPYLVLPVTEAFDRGERPVNVHPSNLVWHGPATTSMVDRSFASLGDRGPRISFLWGSPEGTGGGGSLIEVPAGLDVEIRTEGPELLAVMMIGDARIQDQGNGLSTALRPGSFLKAGEGATIHLIAAEGEDCVFYLKSEGPYRVVPAATIR